MVGRCCDCDATATNKTLTPSKATTINAGEDWYRKVQVSLKPNVQRVKFLSLGFGQEFEEMTIFLCCLIKNTEVGHARHTTFHLLAFSESEYARVVHYDLSTSTVNTQNLVPTCKPYGLAAVPASPAIKAS